MKPSGSPATSSARAGWKPAVRPWSASDSSSRVCSGVAKESFRSAQRRLCLAERLVIAAGSQHCARESDPSNQTLLSERRMRSDDVLEPTLDQAGRIPLSVSENYLSPFAAEVRRRISGQVYALVRLLTRLCENS